MKLESWTQQKCESTYCTRVHVVLWKYWPHAYFSYFYVANDMYYSSLEAEFINVTPLWVFYQRQNTTASNLQVKCIILIVSVTCCLVVDSSMLTTRNYCFLPYLLCFSSILILSHHIHWILPWLLKLHLMQPSKYFWGPLQRYPLQVVWHPYFLFCMLSYVLCAQAFLYLNRAPNHNDMLIVET